MIFHKNGVVRYRERAEAFPYLALAKGAAVPGITLEAEAESLTDMEESDPKDWFDGPPMGGLWIQTLHQRDDYGITMLVLEQQYPEDDEGIQELGLPRFRR